MSFRRALALAFLPATALAAAAVLPGAPGLALAAELALVGWAALDNRRLLEAEVAAPLAVAAGALNLGILIALRYPLSPAMPLLAAGGLLAVAAPLVQRHPHRIPALLGAGLVLLGLLRIAQPPQPALEPQAAQALGSGR